MRAPCLLALLFAAAAGWESGKTCTTDDVRTLAKKDAKLSGTALAECVILDLRGETIAPEIRPGVWRETPGRRARSASGRGALLRRSLSV